MTRKRNLILTFVLTIMLMLCFATKTDALCTSKRYSDLKMIAYKSEVKYELKFDDNHNYYFLLTVNNVDKDILVTFYDDVYEPSDGVVELPSHIKGGKTYEVYLYGGYDTYCPEEYLYTKRITVPKYNVLSERDECIEYEEFYLCNKWYAGNDATEQTFNNKLAEYIDSLKQKEQEEKQKQNKNIIQRIIDFYVNNKIITVPITILIVLFVLYKIIVKIIRRRNRIKLNSK